jgi:hypothetical protein
MLVLQAGHGSAHPVLPRGPGLYEVGFKPTKNSKGKEPSGWEGSGFDGYCSEDRGCWADQEVDDEVEGGRGEASAEVRPARLPPFHGAFRLSPRSHLALTSLSPRSHLALTSLSPRSLTSQQRWGGMDDELTGGDDDPVNQLAKIATIIQQVCSPTSLRQSTRSTPTLLLQCTLQGALSSSAAQERGSSSTIGQQRNRCGLGREQLTGAADGGPPGRADDAQPDSAGNPSVAVAGGGPAPGARRHGPQHMAALLLGVHLVVGPLFLFVDR